MSQKEYINDHPSGAISNENKKKCCYFILRKQYDLLFLVFHLVSDIRFMI